MARFAWMLSMGVGFLSLSQEILWVRIISFRSHGMAQSFALVLFFFLLGIALGSAFGKRLCERRGDLLRNSALVLGAAALLDLGLVAVLPGLVRERVDLPAMLVLIVLTAGLKSTMFPIAHHLGSQQSGTRIGRSVSRVYFGNIVGSTLGPILTGYVLLDRLTLDACLLLVGLSTGVLCLSCAVKARSPKVGFSALAVIVPVALIAWTAGASLPAAIAARSLHPDQRINHMVENRHGIIHTIAQTGGRPDIVHGGNEHDGMVSVDMKANDNALDRALVLLAAHPRPERVLVIGLSTGAWARVLSASPRIKEMTVVEINPAYMQLMTQYPQVSGLLSDPRVHIFVDDGRRWMRRHRNEKYDLIVQNTTFYWRTYSSNLLSQEYLQLTRDHMNPGGILALNSTFSGDVLRTAESVFPHVERRYNFVYGSDKAFARPTSTAEEAYRELALDGRPVFAEAAFQPGGLARAMLDQPFTPHDEVDPHFTGSPGIITDQNLLSEQAHGLMRTFLPSVYRRIDAARAAMGG